ncbi:MAG: GAF domain-containing protein [Anaerolineae bacterium]|nr:GAF domain-containing protein [Anaerolineae bacterium]
MKPLLARSRTVALLLALALGLAALGGLFAVSGTPAGALLALGGVALAAGVGWGLVRERATRLARMAALERQVAELRSLTAVSRAMRTGLDLDSLLDTVYLQAAHLLKVRNFSVALVDPDTGVLGFPVVVQEGRRVEPPGEGATRALVAQALETRGPLLVSAPDMASVAPGLSLPAGAVSWLAVPLWLGVPLATSDPPVGCLVVESRDPARHFTDHDLNLLSIIAAQAGVALDNAQLYAKADRALEQRVRQLSALEAIGREVTATLDLRRVFELVLENAMALTGSAAGVLALRGRGDDEMLRVVEARGYPEWLLDDFRRNPRVPSDGLTARVLREGRPIVVDDVAADPTYRALRPEARSVAAVPIQREEMETIGVLTLESDAPGAYHQAEVGFLTQLAIQASIALDNARLFQEVREGRDHMQAVLNSTYEGMLVIDRAGRVAFANPQIEALTGLPYTLWAKGDLYTLLAGSETDVAARLGLSAAALSNLLDALRAGRHPPVERVQYQLEGRHIERAVAPIQGGAGALIGLLVVLRDVTEAEQLRQMREALSSMIVHDLRAPLTAIQGSLLLINEMSGEAGDAGPLLARAAESSLRAVKRLLNMVESLLDISRIESNRLELECEPTGLRAIVEAVFADLRPLADELEVAFQFVEADAEPVFDIDADKIRRVLLNLVDNALKFTPAEGTVRVVVHPLAEGEPGFARTDVIDAGPGITDEEKARLFDPFVQISGQRGRRRGTGLGLTFCRMVVEAHGGRIWIMDAPDGGSVFAFTLPLAKLDRLPGDEDGAA